MPEPKEKNRLSRQRYERGQRERLGDVSRISDGLLVKMAVERPLSDEEEQQLEREIAEAKAELYRRRGGADAELQLAHDIGEIYPL